MVLTVVFVDQLSGKHHTVCYVRNNCFYSGKTSILFDIALQMAAHHSNQTCFITNKQLQELPVLSNYAPDISNSLLTKIQFEYGK